MKTTGIAVGGQIPGQNLGRNPSFFATVAPNQILALTAWGMSYVGREIVWGSVSGECPALDQLQLSAKLKVSQSV